MITLTPKTLSPFSFLCNPIPKHQNQNSKYTIVTQYSDSNSKPTFNSNCESEFQTERGLKFDIGETFFRHESATGRDLGVLAAALYKRSKGKLRVLDALCGCGIRSLRYLIEAEADFVLANDANDDNRKVITENLSQVESSSGDDPRWAVTLSDANRIMTECYLKRDFFDLIDIDSFGSDSSFLRSAINALKLDGLLYVTSTDGFSSGGRRPQQTLAAYGAYVRPMPYSNELGLRMLIGGAVRVASVLGYRVTPLFSYYSYHGPIFRVMLRVNRGKLPDNRNYGFISYCHNCGSSQEYSWAELGRMSCPCSDSKVSKSLVVSGPLWTGPLHDTVYITEMLHLAEEWGWAGSGSGTDLDKLLNQMVAESDPRLPFGYTKLDEVASRAKVNSPPLRAVMSTLEKVFPHNSLWQSILLGLANGPKIGHMSVVHVQQLGVLGGVAWGACWSILGAAGYECMVDNWSSRSCWEGYAASRSHIESNAIKTNCSMAGCIRIAKQLQQCSSAE